MRKSHNAKMKDINSVILDSIADGVFTVDRRWRIKSFNSAAEKITGISRKEAVGQRCCDIFKASICESDCALRQTIETGKQIVNKTIYIVDSDGNRVPVSISTAILHDDKGNIIGGAETFRDLSQIEELKRKIESSWTLDDIISRNHSIHEIFQILPQVAESSSTVLIEGASGTGKEIFAKAIHNIGKRKDKPFIAINCGAVPDTLLESELFGYKKGAFTDAVKDKPGRFALAKGGTIFLDEIGDISPAMQIRLLRVVQEREYEPLGAIEPEKSNARIITATNRNLEELVESGKFRQDLFYRINVIKITLPTLDERREDIPLLVEHFINRFNMLQDKNIKGVSNNVLGILMAHDFPGNIRELENIIERAFVMCVDDTIQVKHLPPDMQKKFGKRYSVSSENKKIDDLERELIIDSLRRNNGNIRKVAAELGIHKSTVYRKLEKYGIKK